MKLFSKRSACVMAAAAIVATGLSVPSASALLSDNVQFVTGGGAVNCNGGDTCVEKIGDTAHVTYQVQTSALVMSSDHGQTSRGSAVFVPSVLDNVKITLTNIPGEQTDESWGSTAARRPGKAVNQNVPIYDIVKDQKGYARAPEKGGLLTEDFGSAHFGVWHTDVTEFPFADDDSFAWQSLGAAANREQYDLYTFGVETTGVYTFTIEGDVKVESETTVLPIRITNKLWKCSQEGVGPGSYEEGCQSLQEYAWGRAGELPEYSMTDKATNERLLKLNSADGLSATPACVVTRETHQPDSIGGDISSSQAVYERYSQTFTLHANRAVTYIVSGYNEDGCDQAAAVITICDDDTPDQPNDEGTPGDNNGGGNNEDNGGNDEGTPGDNNGGGNNDDGGNEEGNGNDGDNAGETVTHPTRVGLPKTGVNA